MKIFDTVANATGCVSGRFITGVDLDRFNHSSDTLLSGTSTIGQTVNLNMSFLPAFAENMYVYAFVMYDVNYVLQNGLLRAKY
jgi:hypothetical protein